ncbi:MAG: TonB-dependent receptor [Microscillaceae bacterium]|nr:TonB-dependent receptor [Microscillaceae bacterium]
MKQKLLFLCLFFCLGLFSTVLAQERTVTGRITDTETGEGLPGVSVFVKGTNTGTVTDTDGRYSIGVTSGATLVFQAVGMLPQEVLITTQASLDVKMIADTKQLTEVVVVGYGTQDKRDLTGSIAQVKGSEISSLPVQSFEQGLQGRAAGVNITTPNGVLGNAPIIRVRGVNSISSSSQPLIVIDGLPVSSGVNSFSFAVNNTLGDINPSDIESFEVLKDASASAIYGSRAANGVILITTKKGKKGKATVNYDAWVGITEAFRKFDVLNAAEYTQMKNEGYANWVNAGNSLVNNRTAAQGVAGLVTNPDGSVVDTDWYDVVYRAGFQQNHALSVNGATDKTNYLFSAGYTNQEGMLRVNTFRRYTARMNISHKIFDWLTTGANIQYTNSKTQSPNTGATGAFATSGLGRIPLVQPTNVPVYNPDGTYNIDRVNNRVGIGNNAPNAVGLNFPNPQVELDYNKATSESNRILGNIFLDAQIVKGLNLRTSFGIDNLYIENLDFRTRIHGDGFTNGGQVFNNFNRSQLYNWQNTLSYNKVFNEKINLSALIGTELQQTSTDSWGASRQGATDDFFTSFQGTFAVNNPPVGQFQTENGLISYLGRVNFSYADKYLLSANVRRDGFSALALGNKWGNFWGVSAGWRLSQEGFFKSLGIGFISDFKIRGSYGTVGNTFLPSDFGSQFLYGGGLYADAGAWFFTQVGEPNLRWESNEKLDLGFDASLFKDRIQIEFAYYRNNLSDLILFNPQPPSKGIPGNSILSNVAKMQNRGIELTINSTNVNVNGFSWTTSFNITTLENRVLALNETNADINSFTGGLEQTNITRVGNSIGSFFAVDWVGVNPANGRTMFRNRNGQLVQYNHAAPSTSRWTLVDGDTPTGSPAGDRIIAGNALPTWFGGFGNTFKYKGLELNIFLQFSGGNKIYNGTRAGLLDQRMWNNSTEVLRRWTTPGQQTDVPRVVYGDNVSNGSQFAITRNIESGDFIRARNITLAYNLSQALIKKIGLSSVRVFAQVQNAFIITKYTGSDPEVSTNGQAQGFGATNLSPGVDRNSTPQARTYSMGLNIVF